MKLVASLIVRNERHRYLEACIGSLQEFCDAILIIDDASTDGTFEWLAYEDKVQVIQFPSERFFVHEGRARQALLEWTMKAYPTHVLSIDADEFVSEGHALRKRLEDDPQQPVWQLSIEEIWKANKHLYVREDGGWRTHGLPVLWKAPPPGITWRILDRKLACRRVPMQVLSQTVRAKPANVELLHFGWTNPGERAERYARYTQHDGGRFHASAHLKSIMWPDSRVRLRKRDWPGGDTFAKLRERFMIPA